MDRHHAVAEDRGVGLVVLKQRSRLAQNERRALGLGEHLADVVSWIAHGAYAVVVEAHELQGPAKTRLVHGGHEHRLREDSQQADVTEALVHRPVAADEPGSIQAQSNGKPLQRHLLKKLVERALEEGGVDGKERLEACLGQSRHHVHRM